MKFENYDINTKMKIKLTEDIYKEQKSWKLKENSVREAK